MSEISEGNLPVFFVTSIDVFFFSPLTWDSGPFFSPTTYSTFYHGPKWSPFFFSLVVDHRRHGFFSLFFFSRLPCGERDLSFFRHEPVRYCPARLVMFFFFCRSAGMSRLFFSPLSLHVEVSETVGAFSLKYFRKQGISLFLHLFFSLFFSESTSRWRRRFLSSAPSPFNSAARGFYPLLFCTETSTSGADTHILFLFFLNLN